MIQANILVTGGAGFIGSHTCKSLAQAGLNPITVDNLSTGNEEAVKWGPLIKADIRDSTRIERILREFRIDAVLHFAGNAYVGESVEDPAKYYDNNICGSHALLLAMRNSRVNHIVFSSTCATYGIPEHLPIVESSVQVPINPYGFSKLVIERELLDFGQAYGLKSVILRYFNAAGCDKDGEIGEKHNPETHLIPLAILAALGRAEELKIFGTDYDTPDGTAIRDYIHVTDLADAHVKAVQHLLASGDSIICNLGTGQGVSVQDIVAAVEATTGKRVPRRLAPRRPGDPPVLVADASRAAAILSWRPRYTDTMEMVGTAVVWLQKQNK